MNIQQIYEEQNAFLKGHFLLSSGKHSPFYLQCAKVLESPQLAEKLAQALAQQITKANLDIDTICSPAIGGILAGYELARALNKRFIFTERVNGEMTLRRGFEVSHNEKILICEDVITTGGSALESAKIIESHNGKIVAFGALVNRGFCSRDTNIPHKELCQLPSGKPIFALEDFDFPIYDESDCPLCKEGSKPYKPGSRTN